MPCSQTLAGIARDCSSNMGGIKNVYIANLADVDSVTVTSGVVTAITMLSSKKFYKYAFAPFTSSLTSNWNVSPVNGTKYVESTLTMVFNKMDATKRLEIVALAQSELVVIVEDNNGTMFYLGYEEGVRLINGSDGQTGTNRGDRNGYTVVLQDVAGELPMTFTGTVPTA